MEIEKRIGIIFLGIISAIVLYSYFVRPMILEPMCLVNSIGCARMSYYTYNNSVLIQMINSDIWVWYNGDEIFIYGQPVGQLCKDPANYTAAYAISGRTGMKKGYKCVMTLEKVLEFYKERKVKKQKMITRVKDPSKFDVYDVMNLFAKKGIIDLSTST